MRIDWVSGPIVSVLISTVLTFLLILSAHSAYAQEAESAIPANQPSPFVDSTVIEIVRKLPNEKFDVGYWDRVKIRTRKGVKEVIKHRKASGYITFQENGIQMKVITSVQMRPAFIRGDFIPFEKIESIKLAGEKNIGEKIIFGVGLPFAVTGCVIISFCAVFLLTR